MPAAIKAEEFTASAAEQAAVARTASRAGVSAPKKSVGASSALPIREIIGEAWQLFKTHWAMYYGLAILMGLISMVAQYGVGYMAEINGVLFIMLAVASAAVQLVMSLGWMKILVRWSRGEKVEVADLFRNWHVIGKYILGNLFVGLLVLLGLIALVIPGIYLSLKYMFVPYLIADKGLAAGEAMKRSSVMTKGIKLKMILFGLTMIGLNLLGALLLMVGLLITAPVSTLAVVVLYRRLADQRS